MSTEDDVKVCPRCAVPYPDDYAVCPKDNARLVASDLWRPGMVIRAKYRILAQIGVGGMATVYKAHHLLLDEPRAIKVILPELARDAEFARRFQNEAIAARKLNHPNAVRVDDLDIAEDGRPFIAMEFVAGDTLKSVIAQLGALPVTMVLDIAEQLCGALDAAHRIGLVHRDIKPENIVLIPRRDASPLPKILDFGIARLREEVAGTGHHNPTAHNSGLTRTGIVIGTPEYMSPEQALGKRGEQLDGRSDLYSLGIVMYEMLTGELPFQAESTVEMLLHHLKTRPRPPRHLKPNLGIPDLVSGIVMKALRKDRERRFSSAADMGRVIREARTGLRISPQSAQSPPSTLVATSPDALRSNPPRQASGTRPSGRPGPTPVRHTATLAPLKPQSFLEMIKRQLCRLKKPLTKGIVAGVVVLGAIAATVAFSRLAQTRQSGASTKPEPPGETPRHSIRALQKKPRDSAASSAARPQDTATEASLAQESQAAEIPAPSLQQDTRAPGFPRLGDAEIEERARELNSWGESLCKHGNKRQAVRLFRAVLRLDPGNQRASRGIQECGQ
ncbi:MAG TPA: protein kinase [Terriglobia bacterium]|nr:protein kinase [Terriglobia bacterium]